MHTMKRKIEYVLKKVEQPFIDGNYLVSDRGTNGIQLTYEVKFYKHLFSIGNLDIFNLFEYKTEIRKYLRPLKEYWSAERERLPKNYWGTKSHPLCGVGFWWRMKSDQGHDEFDEQIKDQDLIKRLRAATINEEEQLKKPFNPKKFYFYQSKN